MSKILGILLALATASAADPRSQIQQAYARSSKAMGLKFVDGVLSIRSPQFRLIDPDGKLRDSQIERSRLEQLLMPAIRVEESSQIIQFRQQGPKAHCRVHYLTVLQRLDPTSNRPVTLKVETDCEDDWAQAGSDWLLETSRVIRQESQWKAKP